MKGLLGLVVVTVGVLVVQMATGTLSPRFMRLWYRDRLQEVVLAASLRASPSPSRCYGRSTRICARPGGHPGRLAVSADLVLLLLSLDRFGHERMIDQDPAFAVRIIVDIAIRALSPAVNDPTTATQTINYLDLGVSEIRQYGRGSPQVCRRLRAMLVDLDSTALPVNRPPVRRQLEVLDETTRLSFGTEDERAFARRDDSQASGGPSQVPPEFHVSGRT